MTDTKIQRLRGIADAFDDASKSGEWELPKLFREAADELERLGMIEAAAREVFRQFVNQSQDGIQDSVSDLAITVELNPCPK